MNLKRIMLGVFALALVLVATGVAGFAAGKSSAVQDAAAPQSEHKWLASHAGHYNAKISGMMGDSKATSRVESALGGLWSLTHFEGKMMGQDFKGFEILGYDPVKKKYVSVWVDSQNPIMTVTEGTYDAKSKTLTMKGESVGMDGAKAEMVNTTKFSDTGMTFEMNMEGMADALMKIEYTRKDKK